MNNNQDLKNFFRDYLTKSNFEENGKSTYDLFFEMQNEGFTPNSKFYFVKVKPSDIYNSKKNKSGVLNIFGGKKNSDYTNVCNGNLSNQYLEGMIWGKKTTSKKYITFVLLTPSQKKKYETYLQNNNNKDLITPIGILIARLDKNFLHISTICKQTFSNVKEYFTPKMINKMLYNELLEIRFSPRQIAEKTELDNSNAKDLINSKTKNPNKQIINSILNSDSLSRTDKNKLVDVIYNDLGIKLTSDRVIKLIKSNINLNFLRILKGIDSKEVNAKKFYNLQLTNNVKDEIAYSFQMATIGFNFLLGMADILGYQGLSLDSVPEQVGTYSKYGFSPHQKNAHEEFSGEGATDNLTPMGINKKGITKYLSSTNNSNVIKCKKVNLDKICEIPSSFLSTEMDLSQQFDDINIDIPIIPKPNRKKRFSLDPVLPKPKLEYTSNNKVNDALNINSTRLKKKELRRLLLNSKTIGERLRIRRELQRLTGFRGGKIKSKGKKIYIILNKSKKKAKKTKKGGKKKKPKKKNLNIIDKILGFFF